MCYDLAATKHFDCGCCTEGSGLTIVATATVDIELLDVDHSVRRVEGMKMY